MWTSSVLANAFMPHGMCYLWKPELMGLHLVSDAIVAISYFSIPVTLVQIVRKREDLPFDWIFILFAAFIIFCGSGHLLDIWTLWHPNYWLSGVVGAMTAIVSLLTAIALVRLMPKILSLASPAIIEETNQKLLAEISDRKQIEAQLQQERQFLQTILENLSDGIVVCDEEGNLTLFNRATEQFHGLPATNIPFQQWAQHYDLYLPDGKTPMSQEQIPLFRALGGESVRDVEMAIAPKGQESRILLASGDPIVTPEGKKLGAVVVMRDISERKRAEEALRESEQRFFEAFEYAAIGMAIVSPEGRWLRVNKALCELVGYCEQELLATTFQAITHPDDLEIDLNYVRQLLAGEIPTYQLEKRYFHKQGHEVWILLSVALVRDSEAQPLYFIAQIQDINVRKAAQAEILRLNQELEIRVAKRTEQLETANRLKDKLLIREREAKAKIQLYQDVVENIPIGVCIWRLDNLEEMSSFRLLELNPAAGQLLDITRHDDLGKTIVECFPNALTDTHQNAVKAYAEVVRQNRVQELGEVVYGDERRSRQIFGVKAFPLPDRCVGVAFENITERKHIERALVKSTHRYRTVVNSIKEVIFQTDLEGRWTLLNIAWADITGYTIIESLKRSFTDFIFAPEERQHCLKLFHALIAGEQNSFHYEFRIQTKHGDFRWLEINAQLNREDEDEEITGASGTLNDITKRKQTEAMLQSRAEELSRLNTMLLRTASELEKRNKELEQFAYVTSHDLKAPLRAIANLSEWIEEDLEDTLTSDTKHQMSLLRGRVRRMENLINALLQYSRVGRIKSQPERVDVMLLLNEIIDSLAPPPEFTIAIDGEMPILVTERLPLSQVFSNLISNAIKHHHGDKGSIGIAVEDKGNFYQFSVTDDGPGIAPQYHDKIFIIFQTLEARDNKENTGIGLSIVKKIIETQGGTIQIESQLGQGTTFRFTWKK
jgi:PAS domain S-box-containing protein